ncbi:MAG: DMT family transporter [Proteobacteria bacterium]|nr:DMT family transporter [Pseudomonadota bacterium]MBS0573939.1 DMT family transporter [Pseudomonadota bacterium]
MTAVRLSGPFVALVSAALFGASTPLAKLLLGGGTDPFMLAGLLYLGSGTGLACLHMLRGRGPGARHEARLARADLPWLAAVVLFGGAIGPALLMVGLAHTPAAAAALLLNVEGLATMLIAWLVFREHTDSRLVAGAGAILAGALVLAWQGTGGGGAGFGALAIIGACLAWGIDNNLTRKLSAADPVQIAMIKGLAAGSVNLLLALGRGLSLPPPATIAGAAALGFLGYGLSLVLFMVALRHLGSARTGAYFSTAPFIGAALAVPMFGQPVTLQLALAAGLMGLGVWLHLSERHDHEHEHEPMEHDHWHEHDAHHQHEHGPGDPPGPRHSHRHRHERLVHSHPHYPDLHHRHGH